jgi:opacity protein-like surface antigen
MQTSTFVILRAATIVAFFSLPAHLEAQDYFSDQPVEVVEVVNFDLADRLAFSQDHTASCENVSCESMINECKPTPCSDDRRLYISGILGASFANLNIDDEDILDDDLLTAGGVVGLEFARRNGTLRAEIEARGRQNLGDTLSDIGVVAQIGAENIWSTTVNVWREFCLNDRLSIYGGGGIGAGGFDNVLEIRGFLGDVDVNDSTTTFAWQVGTGVTYDINSRMSLDLGYRFFSINGSTATGTWLFGDFSYDSHLSANELVLSLRIYDPLKNLIRIR